MTTDDCWKGIHKHLSKLPPRLQETKIDERKELKDMVKEYREVDFRVYSLKDDLYYLGQKEDKTADDKRKMKNLYLGNNCT